MKGARRVSRMMVVGVGEGGGLAASSRRRFCNCYARLLRIRGRNRKKHVRGARFDWKAALMALMVSWLVI